MAALLRARRWRGRGGGRCPLADTARSPGLRALLALGDRGRQALARGSSCPPGLSLRPVGCPQVGPLLPRSPKNPVLPSGLYMPAFVSGVRWGRGAPGLELSSGYARSHVGYMSFTALYEVILFEKQREGDQLGLGGRELPSGLGGASSGLVIGAPA